MSGRSLSVSEKKATFKCAEKYQILKKNASILRFANLFISLTFKISIHNAVSICKLDAPNYFVIINRKFPGIFFRGKV